MLISLALYHILDLLPSGTKIFYHVLEEPKKREWRIHTAQPGFYNSSNRSCSINTMLNSQEMPLALYACSLEQMLV